MTPTFLMVRPDNFHVKYSINPWMHPEAWQPSLNQTAIDQWEHLKFLIEDAGGKVIVEHDNPNCPDMCFAANAGLVFNNKGLLSLFARPERSKEEPYWHDIFDRLKLNKVVELSSFIGKPSINDYIPFEGAGDCLWDSSRKMFWMGCGIRSDILAAVIVMETFNRSVMSLMLIDPRFYHLDMAMCILPGGEILWYPSAFSPFQPQYLALSKIVSNISISEKDALAFACNLVAVDNTLIVNDEISRGLYDDLMAWGYTVKTTPMSAFIKAGGAAACLTLRLDNTL